MYPGLLPHRDLRRESSKENNYSFSASEKCCSMDVTNQTKKKKNVSPGAKDKLRSKWGG